MRSLNTIQKIEKLNSVYAHDQGYGGVSHYYEIVSKQPADDADPDKLSAAVIVGKVQFQESPRNAESSTRGVLDTDLLEIVRDRLIGFQRSEFATRENACALTHIEEALMWLNRRVEDRIERKVLGTDNK